MKKQRLDIQIHEVELNSKTNFQFQILPGAGGGASNGGNSGANDWADEARNDDEDCLDGCPSSSIADDPCTVQAGYGFLGGMLTGTPTNAFVVSGVGYCACAAGQNSSKSKSDNRPGGPCK